jgi:hypothetical protein
VKTSASLASSFFAALLSAQGQIVLVNEQFTDGERFIDAGPTSLQWTSGAHHATAANAFTSLDASSTALLWDHSNAGFNSFSGIWAHFAPGNAPLSLGVGETLRLTFDVSFSGGLFPTGANAFRWALFDSNNSRVTVDFAGTNATGLSSGTTFGSWKGYAGQSTVSTGAVTGNNLLSRERTGSATGLFTSTEFIDVPGSAVDEPLFTAGTTYAGSLELTRTAGGMQVLSSLAGVTTNLAIDATPVTEFDTVSFFAIDGLTHDVTLDNVVVQVVPEPSSAILLAGITLPFLTRRRRNC